MKFRLTSKSKGIIEKSDFVQYYTVENYVAALKKTEQQITELTAQKSVYDAKCQNVATHYPHILKVSEQDKNAIWLYHENFVASKKVGEMLKQVKASLKNLKAEIKEIEKLGVEIK